MDDLVSPAPLDSKSRSPDSEIASPEFEPLSPGVSSGFGSYETASTGDGSTSSDADKNGASAAASLPQLSSADMETFDTPSKVRAKVLTEKRKNIIFAFRGGAGPTGNGSIGSEVWKLKLFEFFQRKGNDSAVSIYDIHRWTKTHPWITLQTSDSDAAFDAGTKARVPKTNKRQAKSEGELSEGTKARKPKTDKRQAIDPAAGNNEYETPHLPVKAKKIAKRRRLAIEHTVEPPESLSARIRANLANAALKQAGIKLEPLEAPSKRMKTRRSQASPIDEPLPVPAKIPALIPVAHKPSPDVTPLSPTMPILLARNLRKISISGSSETPKKMPKLKRLSAIFPNLTVKTEDSKPGSTLVSGPTRFADPEEEILVVIKDLTKEVEGIANKPNVSVKEEPRKPEPIPDPIPGRPSAECDNLKTLASCIKSVSSFSTDFEEANKEDSESAFADLMNWVNDSFQPEPKDKPALGNANIEKNTSATAAGAQEASSIKPSTVFAATSVSVVGEGIPENLKYVSSGFRPFPEIPPSADADADVDVETIDVTNDSGLKKGNHRDLVRPWEAAFPNTASIPGVVANSPKFKRNGSTDFHSSPFSNSSSSSGVILDSSVYPPTFGWDSNSTSTNNINRFFPLSLNSEPGSGSSILARDYAALTSNNNFGLYSPPKAGEFPPIFASMLQQSNNRGMSMSHFNGNSSPRRRVNIVQHHRVRDEQTQYGSMTLPQTGLKDYRSILPRQTVLDLPSFFSSSGSAFTCTSTTPGPVNMQQSSPIPSRTSTTSGSLITPHSSPILNRTSSSSQTETKPNLSKMLMMLEQLNFTLSTTPALHGCIGSLKHIVRELEKYRRTQMRRGPNGEVGINANGGPEATPADADIPLVDIDD